VTNSVEQTVQGVMADVFGVDASSIDEASSRETIDTWDSANHIGLVLALETEFGVTFEVDEIESMFSFPDIVAVLERKL
jgi:acyl carrier protein